MCGIAGIVNFDGAPVAEEILRTMTEAMAHRGPDGSGARTFGAVGLGHRRLSIIDVEGGAQPMSNEDGSVWIVFNGEIYNHLELRGELEAKGHLFKTHCDTESIIHLYEELGSQCVKRLNGMFAFALLDLSKRKLLLARDRLGKKPLCYFVDGSSLVFASELRALSLHPAAPREIDPQALHDYLTLQYVPSPSTIYQGVKKLPPAHLLELNLATGRHRVERYWHCDYSRKGRIGFADAARELRGLVEDAVRRRLMSDVPLGAFLSGGLDSSIIVGVMAKLADMPVRTFTIGFDDPAYDERPYAAAAAKAFGVEHHEKVVSPADPKLLRRIARHCGEPFADSSILPTYLLCRFARESVAVALGGDGADELFGGYYRYQALHYGRLADFLPLGLRQGLHHALKGVLPSGKGERTRAGKLLRAAKTAASPKESRYLGIISRFDEAAKRAVYGEALADFQPVDTAAYMRALFDDATTDHADETAMEADLTSYLPGDILFKTDIASMANSLELRAPFLDYRIAEFAASLPAHFKHSTLSRKRVLVEAFKDILPPSTLRRRKLGFGVPVGRWLREGWRELARTTLLDGVAVKRGLLDRGTLEKLLDAHQSGREDHSYPLWALLMLELWIESTP